jgi:hypothetical protein
MCTDVGQVLVRFHQFFVQLNAWRASRSRQIARTRDGIRDKECASMHQCLPYCSQAETQPLYITEAKLYLAMKRPMKYLNTSMLALQEGNWRQLNVGGIWE